MSASQSDEEFARTQLESFLLAAGYTDAYCELVVDDPPDLVCYVGGEAWAFEVTRVDQRIVEHGFERSRSENDIPLMKFGIELGKQTKELRTGEYLLILHGPIIGSNWSKWKKRTTKAIKEFLCSKHRDELDFDGGSIKRCDSGQDWVVAVAPRDDALTPSGHLGSDIAANIESLLIHALSTKAQKLSAIKGFKKIGLVLLNVYFFGDDVEEVRRTIHAAISRDSKCDLYDFIFYTDNQRINLVYQRTVPIIPIA